MSMSDPIADALTRVRNAYKADHKTVAVNYSKLIHNIVRILNEENYVNGFEIIERNKEKKIFRKMINVKLRYTNEGEPVLRGLKRESKPGRRVFVKGKNIPSVFNNTGIAIISTSQGVLVDRKARKIGVGGEFVCRAW